MYEGDESSQRGGNLLQQQWCCPFCTVLRPEDAQQQFFAVASKQRQLAVGYPPLRLEGHFNLLHCSTAVSSLRVNGVMFHGKLKFGQAQATERGFYYLRKEESNACVRGGGEVARTYTTVALASRSTVDHAPLSKRDNVGLRLWVGRCIHISSLRCM